MPAGRNFETLPRPVTIFHEPKCGVILTLYSTYSCKIAVTFEQFMQFWRPSRFRIYNKYKTWFKLWFKAPSLTMCSWRRRDVIFTKDASVNLLITEVFLNSPLGFKIPNHGAGGSWGPLRVHRGASWGPQGPNHSSKSLQYKFCMTSWRLVSLQFKLSLSLCLWGLWGPAKGPLGVKMWIRDQFPIAIMIL